jgi:hypothetical protein
MAAGGAAGGGVSWGPPPVLSMSTDTDVAFHDVADVHDVSRAVNDVERAVTCRR